MNKGKKGGQEEKKPFSACTIELEKKKKTQLWIIVSTIDRKEENQPWVLAITVRLRFVFLCQLRDVSGMNTCRSTEFQRPYQHFGQHHSMH